MKTFVPLLTMVPPQASSLARCPEPCRCSCTNDNLIFVDCSSSGLTHLPPLFTEEQNSTVLEIFLPRANKKIPFVIEAEIEGLNLSNNKLKSVEEARLPNRTSALDFKKWVISKSILVLDVNETRCGPDMPDSPGLAERAIWLLRDQDLCPDNTGLIISVVCGVLSFLLVVAGGIIAWTRYKMNVKVWLYSHGVTWVKEKDIDRDKEFDAFISFSHRDQDFAITELIKVKIFYGFPGLSSFFSFAGIEEKVPDIRLCLHYKHFLPGEYIQENIVRAVECSKRTVLVLSRNFLESEWCLLGSNWPTSRP
ncbi:protein toll [Caerostris extrusa]|uniref:Protein toll n=1 Tax=Caerostris extrusa TaxID=172846 RepID=A0AAV4SJX1_CAEEX|nr:protein toll [Caerostris extrusa]